MGIFKKLFGHNSETDDQREERLYYETVSETADSGACLKVADVFTVNGRGTVAVGKVTGGDFHVGDKVKINSHSGGSMLESRIICIESFMRQVKTAKSGEHSAFLLDGVSRDQINKDDLIIK